MNREPGQVWRWFSNDEFCRWDELWLLLFNPYPNRDAWEALNLETGERDTIFPDSSHYERVT